MSLEDQTNLEDNQRNQKPDQSQSSYHRTEEQHHTTTTTTTTTNNNTTSIQALGFLSPPESPLGPVTSNPPMTSTPLITSTKTSINFISQSTHGEGKEQQLPNSQAVLNNNHNSENSSVNTVEVLSTVTTMQEQTNQHHKSQEPHSTNIVASAPAQISEMTDSAITIIQVQSTNSQSPRSEVQDNTIATSPPTTMISSNSHTKETDLDINVDGLAVTRIKVTGEKPPQYADNQVVKVTVLNGSGNPDIQNITQEQVTLNNGEEDDDHGRGPVRFEDHGVGMMGSQPSDLNDTVSEMSSVVNNPSVISQLPDRYGFMGGEQFTHESEPDPSPEIVRRREMKWLQMMDKWDHFMRKDFKTVRSRCRKGIPRSVRGRAWYYLCGAAFIKKKDPDLFFQLLQQDGKPSDVEDIKKDLHRQFPWHEIFAEEGHGKKDLFNVLKAHSILNSKDGYCQAQAPIASILLMHMPAEDAFWCLVAICDKYLKGYYSPGMEQLQLDGDILFGLLKRVAPPVYKHMKKQKIDPVLYMTEWFLCAFTRTLPWSSVLRVWDSFLCEGVKVLFRVGLILLKYTLGRPGILKQCPSMYETLSMLKNLPNYVTHEQFLVAQIQRMDVSDDQMRREHYKQVVKRKKVQQKLEAAKKQQQKSSGSRQNPGVYRSHETSL